MSASGFDIQEFLSSVTPPLKASKFLFRVNAIPPGLISNSGPTWTKTQKSLSFYAETVDLPGLSLMTTNVIRYGYGPIERKPYAPLYQDLRVLFRGDQDGTIWNFMRSWMGVAVNYQMSSKDTMSDINGFIVSSNTSSDGRGTPYEVAYKSDYATSVSIILMNEKGDVAQRISLADAYPYRIEDTPLSWNAHDTYAQFPVSFAYSKYAIFGDDPT